MRSGLSLHLLCHLSAIGLARWWWTPPTAPRPPQQAEPRSAGVRGVAAGQDTDESTLVPLSECLAAALETKSAGSFCPDPCTPCPACEAGEASWTLQVGLGLLAYLILEALKAVVSLASSAARAFLPAARSTPEAGRQPVCDQEEPLDFAKLAAEQARASRSRSQCAAHPNSW